MVEPGAGDGNTANSGSKDGRGTDGYGGVDRWR